MHEVVNDEYSKAMTNAMLIVSYFDDRPVRRISQVSPMYKFVTPKTWLTEIQQSVSRKLVGDIALTQLQVNTNSVLALFKLPVQFTRAKDDGDGFGLTLLAHNTYTGTKSAKLGLGSIRFACTNGCVWGDHSAVSLKHRGAEGDKLCTDLDDYLHPLVESGSQHARGYIEALVRTPCELKDGLSVDAEMTKQGWNCRQMLYCMEDAIPVLLMRMPISFRQKLQVLHRCLVEKTESMYDVYNHFTWVASHSSHIKYDLKRQVAMLHAINDAFDKGGTAWNEQTTPEEQSKMRALGWQNGWWWSFDLESAEAAAFCPAQEPKMRKKRKAVCE